MEVSVKTKYHQEFKALEKIAKEGWTGGEKDDVLCAKRTVLGPYRSHFSWASAALM